MKKLVVLQLTAFIALFALSAFATAQAATHSAPTAISTIDTENLS